MPEPTPVKITKFPIEYSRVLPVHSGVKTKSPMFRLFRLAALPVILGLAGSSVSCVTTYDAAGRPVQTVDPAVAVAGVAAAGLIGYAIAQDNGHHHGGHYGGYYRGGYYRPYRPYCY